MLSTRIIPCLDVHNGRTVKGINFLNLQDAGDPVEQAKLYSEVGADEICFLDISATNEQRKAMFDVISKTAETSLVPLTVGGGVNSLDDFRKMLNSGADKVSINSSAVYNPSIINEINQEIFKRLYKPFFIPIIAILSCFLIIVPKNNYRYERNRKIIFVITFFVLIISEASLRYSTISNLATLLYLVMPIVSFILIYGIFYRSVKNV